MNNNQNGFGVVEALVIVVIVGLVGFGGWYMWSQTSANSNNKSTKDTGNKKQESYVVPEGYKTYENTELGFKLAYPEEWDVPQTVTDANAALTVLLSDETFASEGDVKGGLQIFSAQTKEFELNAAYKSATLTPEASGNAITWKVKAAGLTDMEVGSIFTPAPKVLYEKGRLKVYEFPASHASSAWATLAFAVDSDFVGVATPLFNPSADISQEEFDTRRTNFNTTLVEVAKSIRLL